MPDDADPPDDAYEQARICLEIIERALAEAGARLDDVVRTRIYVTDAADIDEVGRAHRDGVRRSPGRRRPASSPTLLDPRWLVEIEAEAVLAMTERIPSVPTAEARPAGTLSSVLDHRFGTSEPYTLGVEEEFMLLDPETWDLVQHIDAVLATVAEGEFAGADPLRADAVGGRDHDAGLPDAGRGRRAAAAAARATSPRSRAAEGCRFASAGTHPFSLFERQRITAKDRYRTLVDQMQYIARRELIFGMHVHTAVDDPDKAIAVTNALLLHLPEFLALSASSPFWRGEPTGLQSSRQMVFSAFPRSGVPPRFSSYAEYAEVVGQLERTGCIADYTHIWWDIRAARAARHGRAADLRRGHERRRRGRDRRVLPGARQALLRAGRGGRRGAELPPDPDRREQVARGALRARARP